MTAIINTYTKKTHSEESHDQYIVSGQYSTAIGHDAIVETNLLDSAYGAWRILDPNTSSDENRVGIRMTDGGQGEIERDRSRRVRRVGQDPLVRENSVEPEDQMLLNTNGESKIELDLNKRSGNIDLDIKPDPID